MVSDYWGLRQLQHHQHDKSGAECHLQTTKIDAPIFEWHEVTYQQFLFTPLSSGSEIILSCAVFRARVYQSPKSTFSRARENSWQKRVSLTSGSTCIVFPHFGSYFFKRSTCKSRVPA